MHTCPAIAPGTPATPHVGGPITGPGASSVLIGGLPAARITDAALCDGPPDVIVTGSTSVLIEGLPAARVGDATAHGGIVASGCATVLVGG
jgi:uncharacterized Zn-binding protein involved in type VI secretion